MCDDTKEGGGTNKTTSTKGTALLSSTALEKHFCEHFFGMASRSVFDMFFFQPFMARFNYSHCEKFS